MSDMSGAAGVSGKSDKTSPSEDDLAKRKPGKKLTGFALLSPERRREVSRLGGKTCQEMGCGNSFTSETARKASRKVKNRVVFDSARGREASKMRKSTVRKSAVSGGSEEGGSDV